MCLSTIYRNEKQDSNILCKFVSTITADGDKLIFSISMFYSAAPPQGVLNS